MSGMGSSGLYRAQKVSSDHAKVKDYLAIYPCKNEAAYDDRGDQTETEPSILTH